MAILSQPYQSRPDRWLKRLGPLSGLFAWLLLFIAPSFAPDAARGQSASREYQVKAVFLYNFIQFTEWPTNAFSGTNTPLVIGILGADPFGRFLEETVSGEKKNGRSIVVKKFSRVEDVQDCQVLFVAASENSRLAKILPAMQGTSILTVGETAEFVQNGGIIRFSTDKNKIRFHINVPAAKTAKLAISSKLLRLGETTSGGKE